MIPANVQVGRFRVFWYAPWARSWGLAVSNGSRFLFLWGFRSIRSSGAKKVAQL